MGNADLQRIVPLGMHGDAGAFNHQDSVLFISWNSLVGDPSSRTLSKRFPFTVIKNSDMVKSDTVEAILRIFAWSLNCIFRAEHPSQDWAGRPWTKSGPLAGAWRGALVQCRGDWPFFCDVFQIPRHNERDNMCWLCNASSDTWTDFASSASWRANRRSHSDFVEKFEASGKPLPAMFEHCIGFKLEFLMIDVLHCVDLGVAALIAANVMWEVMPLGQWGRNQQSQIEGLNQALKAWYRGQPASVSRVQGPLTVQRLRPDGQWPKLKCKAAATRHLSAFVLELATKYNDGSRHARSVQAVAQLLVRFYEILDQEDRYLTDSARRELPKLGYQLCNIYRNLSVESYRAGHRLWKLAPKLHQFLHLCEWQCPNFGNPRFWWTYADEDLVGHVIKIAKSTHSSHMALATLNKWRALFFEA